MRRIGGTVVGSSWIRRCSTGYNSGAFLVGSMSRYTMTNDDLKKIQEWIDTPIKGQYRHAQILPGGVIHLIQEMGGTRGWSGFSSVRKCAEALSNGTVKFQSI